MKKTFRRAMLSTICMLVVAVMSLTGVTYAWFTQSTTSTVSGMEMEVIAAEGGVQVSAYKDNAWTNYASTVNLESSLTEVRPSSSTDGIKFYQLDVSQSDSTMVNSIEATGNYMISNRIKLKNPGKGDITVVLDATNTKITDKASSANVTTEIGKAAKIAIIVTDADGNVLTTGTNANKTYIVGDAYTGIKDTSTGYTTELSNGIVPVGDIAAAATVTAPGSCEITLPGITEDGTETEVFLRIVLWLEGQDTDCVNKNAGGAFDAQLQFTVKG